MLFLSSVVALTAGVLQRLVNEVCTDVLWINTTFSRWWNETLLELLELAKSTLWHEDDRPRVWPHVEVME